MLEFASFVLAFAMAFPTGTAAFRLLMWPDRDGDRQRASASEAPSCRPARPIDR